MSTYTLRRSCRLIDERKNKLDVEYFLIEEFSLKEQCKTYGIKVETRENGKLTDTCSVSDVSVKQDEALYILEKMADYEVTAVTARDVIEDMAL